MKSDFYLKLSALLIIVFSNICCINSLNLKKTNLSHKKSISNYNNENKDFPQYILTEKIIPLKTFSKTDLNKDISNISYKTFHFNQNNEDFNEDNLIFSLIPKTLKQNNNDDFDYLKDLNIEDKNYSRTNIITKRISNSTNSFINNSNSKIIDESQLNKINYMEYYNNNTNNLKKVFLGISIYSQLFLIFCTVSLLRLYEEYFKAKTLFCNNKYSYYKILTQENKELISSESSNYIFTSGKPEIKEEALDKIFDFPKDKKYVKIERIVEIYRADEKQWKILGKKALKNNTSFFFEEENKSPDMIEDMEEEEKDENYKLDINTLEEIYTFPKIFTKMILGKVLYFELNFFYK